LVSRILVIPPTNEDTGKVVPKGKGKARWEKFQEVLLYRYINRF
jgi:uncharacterized membrane-anchored protein